ncbi:V-type ATP synthase subunit B [Hujiaoplasma nucleasis]|uniref:V-type ATP synthase beta chain n=1 Tax=Hujiaoplasma nucleasis TaxID=2725268 RepID=A0A7L6N321_9MOLU|nr:V-type ATP synthase subunit B [Hujiaoplasma nucleasis]QLY40563.1 V-type ATP synthase subunit B [Hujiaoplasma nucleasis]
MNLQYIGLKEINGPLIFLNHVKGISFEEMVEIKLDDGSVRHGRVVEIKGDMVAILVFEGTHDLSLKNTTIKFLGHSMEIGLSENVLGRVFNGLAEPIDDLGHVYVDKFFDINGSALNPVARVYPRDYINTGISSIDGLTTLIRGQKLPIFSGSGMPHNDLAVQIVQQAKLSDEKKEKFAIIFAAMGVTNDVANYFKKSFEEAGVFDKVAMYLNLADDPIIERILTPRCALTAAEYLAYERDYHVLVVMTDMTSYCEALREFSSSKGEIPGRKGYPGYLYSDLASLFERAGIIRNAKGSVTQIPILSMPNDDITHPIPDLTGYITEGQIVLDRELHQRGVYPPIGVLPSLSRLMKDGIGQGYTREDHQPMMNQLFASYARVMDARSLASVIGEDELSPVDKLYMVFGRLFENHFISQGKKNRSIIDTLDLGWRLLSFLPKEELDRTDEMILDRFYNHEDALVYFNIEEDVIIKELNKEGR